MDEKGMTNGTITKRKMIGDSIFEETSFSFTGKDEKTVLDSLKSMMDLSLEYEKRSNSEENGQI